MLVFGDGREQVEVAEALGELLRRGVACSTAGPRSRSELADLLVDTGRLVQGLIDQRFEMTGVDAESPLGDAAMQLVGCVADALVHAWRNEPWSLLRLPEAIAALRREPLPRWVACSRPEGHAYYALYPEAYADAARGLDGRSV
ncbi:MAG TPA: hypothetical protein VFO41_17280, partial [Alphaproteobacteria bacterium]|nr:hypothetical protein [Alphaproteobacteria bacterium]